MRVIDVGWLVGWSGCFYQSVGPMRMRAASSLFNEEEGKGEGKGKAKGRK